MDINRSIESSDISICYSTSDIINENTSYDCCCDKYKIIYSLSYGGEWNVEGANFTIHPGSIVLLSPFSCHHVDLSSAEESESYTLLFNKSSLSEGVLRMLERMMDNRGASCLYYSPDKITLYISDVFRRSEVAQTLPEEEKDLYLQALLSELIIFLSAINVESNLRDEESLGARVLSYLNNNIDKNISLDKLARRFFVNKYYLCRAFKEYSGISVHSFINHKRIMYAKKLIESGVTASGAAERVGFGDYSAFYRAYLRIVGKSPSAE